jgi:hypothetical protein
MPTERREGVGERQTERKETGTTKKGKKGIKKQRIIFYDVTDI